MMAFPSPRRGETSSAFTLIELLVVVAIIALLISILLPSLGRAKELANRVYCLANLRSIMQGMIVYAQDGNSTYPVCRPPGAPNTYVTGFNAIMAFPSQDAALLSAGNKQGVPLSSLWMLTLRGQAPPKIFICKSDRFVIVPALTVNNAMQFADGIQDATQISYSIACPWLGAGTIASWHEQLGSTDPIACDMAPLSGDGGKQTNAPLGSPIRVFTSANHEDKGQNVAFGDGHAEWFITPYCGGMTRDNIFTAGPGVGTPIGTLGTVPSGMTGGDTVMIPVRKTSDGAM